jgi:hypothetical protein
VHIGNLRGDGCPVSRDARDLSTAIACLTLLTNLIGQRLSDSRHTYVPDQCGGYDSEHDSLLCVGQYAIVREVRKLYMS